MLPKEVVISLIGALTALLVVLLRQSDRELSYVPPTGVNARPEDAHRGRRWLADCLDSDTPLYAETRLTRPVFDKLVEHCLASVKDGRRITIEEKVLTFLYICAQGSSWRNAGYRCGHSLSTITVNFYEVLAAVLQLYKVVVKPPPEQPSSVLMDDPRRWPYFKDCIGALDGSHIKIYVPASDARRYRNRHGGLSQNVLAVVDLDMNFIYVLAGWEGSAHDGRVLNSAIQKGFGAPAGKYFVADAGYTNTSLTLTPYRSVRYHLRDIAQLKDGRPQTPKELFNSRHSSLRNVVERCFGVFKRRWRIFDKPHRLSVATQVKLVYALVAIHNLINIVTGDVSADLDELGLYEGEDEEAQQRDAENTINLASGSSEMSQLRESIARDMWEDYQRAQQVLQV